MTTRVAVEVAALLAFSTITWTKHAMSEGLETTT